MSTHTQGPWKLQSITGDFTHGIRANGQYVSGYVAFVNTRWSRPEQCREQEANALLIAAAPELLTLAKDLLDSADNCECGQPECKTTKARAIIAKAEGRS